MRACVFLFVCLAECVCPHSPLCVCADVVITDLAIFGGEIPPDAYTTVSADDKKGPLPPTSQPVYIALATTSGPAAARVNNVTVIDVPGVCAGV